MIINLPIFFNTDATQELENASIAFSIEKCGIENVAFININAISAYNEEFDGEEKARYSKIHCNGERFICAWKKSKVESYIKKQELIQILS
jgi:hypothetical protein